jgi:hypothetical protein
MQSDVSFERRFRYQEMAIARLMCEARLLRDENAQLLAQLAQAAAPGPAGAKVDRLEATLPAGPSGPAAARAALTRWLTGQVPGEVLSDVRVLASELVAKSSGGTDLPETASLRLVVEVHDDALRVDVRHPGGSRPGAGSPVGGGLGLQLVEALAKRWGVDDVGGTHLWFEVEAAV